MFLEVLVEGASEVPTVREILGRRFGLVEDEHFRVHPHRGKGKLPRRARRPKTPLPDGLLDQLPVKVRNLGAASSESFPIAIVVLVDADDDDYKVLKRSIQKAIGPIRANVLIRIAVEELESWFIAEPAAIRSAFPSANTRSLNRIGADSVCGAWEKLAAVLRMEAQECSGVEKFAWAEAIAPHIDLDAPRSPSLRAFVNGIERLLSTSGP